MSGWGSGSWGTSAWGSPGAPALLLIDPAVADTRGGTTVTLYGLNFFDPAQVELVRNVTTVGRGQYLSARLDLRLKKMIVGLPALPADTYGIRVTTPYGSSFLPNCVEFRLFAEEVKVHRVRGRWSAAWAVGPRLLGSTT